MKLWIDTEFNGFNGALLSIAMVDEDGREFYEVLHCEDDIDPWVAANVLPHLEQKPVDRRTAQVRMMLFMGIYPSVHIIADWPDDIRHFCDMLITGPGERINTPRLTMEIRRDINSDASTIPHNALADAHALRLSYLKSTKEKKS